MYRRVLTGRASNGIALPGGRGSGGTWPENLSGAKVPEGVGWPEEVVGQHVEGVVGVIVIPALFLKV